MSYWDSSALLKLYAKESDSTVFEQFAAAAVSVPVISRIGIYEMQTALRRKESEGTLAIGAAEVSCARLVRDSIDGHIRVIEFSADVERKFRDVLITCFQKTPRQFVRTLDAIHLGAALVSGETVVVATDQRLRDAAAALSLAVFP